MYSDSVINDPDVLPICHEIYWNWSRNQKNNGNLNQLLQNKTTSPQIFSGLIYGGGRRFHI